MFVRLCACVYTSILVRAQVQPSYLLLDRKGAILQKWSWLFFWRSTGSLAGFRSFQGSLNLARGSGFEAGRFGSLGFGASALVSARGLRARQGLQQTQSAGSRICNIAAFLDVKRRRI